MKFPTRRFITSFFAVALVLLLQLKFGAFLGWSPSLFLTTLVALSFFLSLGELLFFALLGVWIFNPEPDFLLEGIMIGALPLLAFALKDVLPWTHWLNNVALVAASLVVFYAAIDYLLIIKIPKIFFEDFITSIIFGMLAFQSFNYFFKKQ